MFDFVYSKCLCDLSCGIMSRLKLTCDSSAAMLNQTMQRGQDAMTTQTEVHGLTCCKVLVSRLDPASSVARTGHWKHLSHRLFRCSEKLHIDKSEQ